jgi:hypothetical protein
MGGGASFTYALPMAASSLDSAYADRAAGETVTGRIKVPARMVAL